MDVTLACIDGDPGSDRAADRLAIADMTYLYAEGVDALGNSPPADGAGDVGLAQATDIFAQCMTEDATLQLFLAGPGGPMSQMGSGGPREFAKAVRAYFTAYKYVGTHHHAGNIRAVFEGPDRATVSSLISCFHWLADGRMLLTPVRYADEATRANGRWKIANRKIYAVRFWLTDGYAADPLDPTLSRKS